MDKSTSPALSIRPYLEQDQKQVIKLMVQAFKNKFTFLSKLPEESIESFLYESKCFNYTPYQGYFISELNGRVVGVISLMYKNQKRQIEDNVKWSVIFKKYGFIPSVKLLTGLMLMSESVEGRDCYIEHIAVSPEAQGQGVGTQLLEVAEEFVRSNDYLDRLTLHVAMDNEGAINVYKKIGYSIVNKRKSLLTKLFFNKSNWLFMKKEVN